MAAFERASMGLFLWWSANAAVGGSRAHASSFSRFGVAETAGRIAAELNSRGFRVLEHIDHSGLAARDGYQLRPTQSMLVDGAVGSNPVRLVIWQTRNGMTMVSRDGHAPAEPQGFDGQLPAVLQTLAPDAPESGLMPQS